MKRSYLFAYSDRVGTRDQVVEFIDKQPDILHWRHDIPNMFYLVSEKSAEELYEVIKELNKERGIFLVCEVGENKEGWLPKKTWTVLNEKRRMGEDDEEKNEE